MCFLALELEPAYVQCDSRLSISTCINMACSSPLDAQYAAAVCTLRRRHLLICSHCRAGLSAGQSKGNSLCCSTNNYAYLGCSSPVAARPGSMGLLLWEQSTWPQAGGSARTSRFPAVVCKVLELHSCIAGSQLSLLQTLYILMPDNNSSRCQPAPTCLSGLIGLLSSSLSRASKELMPRLARRVDSSFSLRTPAIALLTQMRRLAVGQPACTSVCRVTLIFHVQLQPLCIEECRVHPHPLECRLQ